MSTTAFTVDDLTVDEHQRLARLVKGNPGAALADPSSQQAGMALAGLAMLRDQRGRAGVKLEDYTGRTLRQLQLELGLLEQDRTAERMATALVWLDRGAQRTISDDLPDLIDPNDLDDDQQRAVVFALTGVDPVDDEHGPVDDEPTVDEQAQQAIDELTGENGTDPTVRPASPCSPT
jgi:hypothetical protein